MRHRPVSMIELATLDGVVEFCGEGDCSRIESIANGVQGNVAILASKALGAPLVFDDPKGFFGPWSQ